MPASRHSRTGLNTVLLATLELLDSGPARKGVTARERLHILLLLALNGYPVNGRIYWLGEELI